jgi:hypothetical protein
VLEGVDLGSEHEPTPADHPIDGVAHGCGVLPWCELQERNHDIGSST